MKKVLSYLLVLVMLTACGGLPKEAKEQANKSESKCTDALTYITVKEADFDAIKKSPDAEFITVYSKREKWSAEFETAKSRVADVQNYIKSTINPLLKRNKKEELNNLYTHIKSVNLTLREAKDYARKPEQRKQFLLEAKKTAPELQKKAKHEVKELTKLVVIAKTKSEQAKKDAKKKDWPKTNKDIDEVFAPLQIDLNSANKDLKILNHEMVKVTKGMASTNYATIGDRSVNITKLLTGMKVKQRTFLSKTEQLYRSYSKTLVDMRVEYYVAIGRASWDNSSDWDNTADAKLTSAEVSEEVYNYFETFTQIVGTYGKRWREGFKPLVPSNYWFALKINPKAAWPSKNDDEGEYWVEGAFTKTYHKYVITENEKESETGWKEVSEDFYWTNDENLGMTIVSKPYGFYEDETIKDAAPKGMQYVAPAAMVAGVPTGENKYGKWQQDSSGNSFFHYYGMYALLFGNNTYSYNDYNGYSNRKRGSNYYGHSDGYGTYGRNTYRKGSRYGKSNYAKRNPSSVRTTRNAKPAVRSQKGSVRGAGTASRGRGASGKGGK